MSFAHLHVHTEFSVLDGAAKINKLIEAAEKNNQPALAITDHGNMFGVKKFLDSIKKSSVKPIIGCEVYMAKGSRKERKGREDQSSYHLILLAKNIKGYRNLIKLVSSGYIDGFYYKPRIDRELLEKHAEGLICSSACIAGEPAQYILQGNIAAAEESILWHKQLFGDDYYLEIQRHETNVEGSNKGAFELQEKVNPILFEFAAKHNIKTIATNDVHFVAKEDAEAHDRLICVSTNANYDDPKRMRYSHQEYLKSTEEMVEIFKDHPEVISNTIEIVDKVEVYSLDSDPLMPPFPIPEGFANEDEYLTHVTYEGAKKRYSVITPEIKERVDFELDTIIRMKYTGYFLIVQDFIVAARNMGVSVGPGRGSAAGSVVAYCLTITDIDPIKYQLLFERFLNPDRASMPDIDIDFDDDGRHKVLQYVENKYGKDHVSHVVTFGTMGTKSAIKDIFRIQNVELKESDRLSKLVPKKVEITLESEVEEASEGGEIIKKRKKIKKEVDPTLSLCLENLKEFKDAYENGQQHVKDALNYAAALEGTVRNIGVHACAILIGPEALSNLIPLSTAKEKDTGEDIFVSQFEGKLIESVGLLKMDFLGLRTLSIIKECVSNVKKSQGLSIDINSIPIDDIKTFDLFSRGDTIGVFQFESEGMQKWLKELKPTRFEDLIAMNALYRPGPMDYIPDFVDRKHGRQAIEYDLPEMEEYLQDTYGITVYQEQVMLLSQKIANFTKGKADILRKAMGKKQLSVMAALKEEFFEGGIKNKHPESILNKIWNDWKAFAEYAFNKSHSTCYAWIGYQTAYLKAHHPAEFLAANLSKNLNNMDEITKLMDDCKKSEIKVLCPSVNESDTNFTVNTDGDIRFGLGGIKGIGTNAVNSIINERSENGIFKDVFDFIERVSSGSLNKKGVESLIFAGAFDEFPDINRGSFSVIVDDDIFLESYIRYGQLYYKDLLDASNSIFGDIQVETSRPSLPPIPEIDSNVLLQKEKELVGVYLSAHPLDIFKFEIDHFSELKVSQINPMVEEAIKKPGILNKEFLVGCLISNVQIKTSKNGRPWATFTMEDYYSSFTLNLFGKDYESYLKYLSNGTKVLARIQFSPRYEYVKKDSNDRGPRKPVGCDVKILNMTLLGNVTESYLEELNLDIHVEKLNPDFRKNFTKILKKSKGNSTLGIKVLDVENKLSAEFFSRKYKITPSIELIDFLKKNKITYNLKVKK